MRSAIVVCIALALALCGWLFLAQEDTPPPVAPAPVPVATAPAAATPATAAVDASASEATNERTSAPVADNASEQPPIPADATWIEVLIVDKTTQQPVAGADAWWTDETQWPLVRKLPPAERSVLQRDQDAMAQRFGWRGRSDKDGKLRVTLGKHGSRVMAREGQRFGEKHFTRAASPPPDGHRVLLTGDLTLRVRVFDHAGRVAEGVPLGLDDFVADGKSRHTIFGAERETGADGIATFPHVQARQTVAWGPDKGKTVAQWAVRVAIHGLDVQPIMVDAQSPPVDPIEVTLPPTGRLVVGVTYEGKPPPGVGQLRIHTGPKDDSTASNSAWTRYVDVGGIAHFGHVPLGKTFFIDGNSGASWDFEVQGPRVPDQEVRTSIELSGDLMAVAGRLLESDGKPVAEQFIRTNFDVRNVTSGGGQVQTDANGQFLWILGRLRADMKPPVKLEKLSFDRQVDGASPQRIVVSPRELVVGRNDLGEMRFAVDALVVSGRFVFDTPGSSRTWFQIERHSERQGRSGPVTQWNSVDGLQIATQEDGTFEARGTVNAGRYRIAVQPQNHLPVDPVEFVPGASDLQIAVRRGTPLQAKCHLPDGVEPQRISLDLQAPGAQAPASVPGPRRFAPNADPLRAQSDWGGGAGGVSTYKWPALPPGTYSLRVSAAGFVEPLLTLADVVVPPPEGGDPRLMDLDLRPVVGTLRLRVRTPDPGDPSRNRPALVFPQPQPADATWSASMVGADETVLPVPKRPVDLLITRDGCRPANVRGAIDSVDVTMEPWASVEVRFDGIAGLPEGAILRATVTDVNPDKGRQTHFVSDYQSGTVETLLRPSGGSQVAKDGVATLLVGDGAWKLAVSLRLDARGRSKALKQVTPNEIAAGAPITVQLSTDEVRAVVEELKQPPPEKK